MKISHLLVFIAGALVAICLMAIGVKIAFPNQVDLNYVLLSIVAFTATILSFTSIFLNWKWKK